MRTHADPTLVNLTADQLTVTQSVFDKQPPVEPAAPPTPELVVPTPPVGAPATPISAFCFLPSKSEGGDSHGQMPKVAVSGAVAGGGGGTVDLFQDSSAYVQHCLSFVALPSTEYMPQTDLTAQPLSDVHRQP